MRLTLELKPRKVEVAQLRSRIYERVVITRAEYHRVRTLFQGRYDLPTLREIEADRAGAFAVSFGHQEKLCAREESEVLGNLCLIQSQHIGAIIKLRLDSIKALRLNAPGLLARHLMPDPVARAVGNVKAQDVLSVVFNRVPAGRPYRQREVQARLFDVLYVGCHVKKLLLDAGNFNRVINA